MTAISGHVIVTGGAGAIGSRLVRRLLGENVETITVIDNLSSGHEWLVPREPRVQFLRADVCDLLNSGLRVESPTVFHLAAFFANQNSVEHPTDDLRTNGLGTLVALLWSRKNRASRFVYASAGCSIAGHGVEAAIREDMPVSLHLDTPYQITKALGEFYCNYFNSELPTVRARFFNSYGPGEIPGQYRNVIPNFVWNALRGEPLTITGTGEETRDFIFVDDLAEGLLLAASKSRAIGEAFNLGTGIQTRIIDLATAIVEICGSRSRILYAPRRDWDRSSHREADVSRARERLGFTASVGVRDGLTRTVQWFREHMHEIEDAVQGKGAAAAMASAGAHGPTSKGLT